MLEQLRRQDRENRKQLRPSLAARINHPNDHRAWNMGLRRPLAFLAGIMLGFSILGTAFMWHHFPEIGEREGNIEHLAVMLKTYDSALADDAQAGVVERYHGYSQVSGYACLAMISFLTTAAIRRMLMPVYRRNQAMRICPACRSRVDPQATVCRYCRSPLSPPAS
jgi:hypothetical protein